MNKHIVNAFAILVTLGGITLSASAQTIERNAIEADIFVGPNLSLGPSKDVTSGDAIDSDPRIGFLAGVELRYNLPKLPLDIGIYGSYNHIIHNVRYNVNDKYTYRTNTWVQSFQVAATADWNFRRPNSKWAPFAGLGLGVSFAPNHNYDQHLASLLFMPRVGIEFNDRIRLSLNAQVAQRGYHTMSLTAAYTFGGRPKALITDFKTPENFSEYNIDKLRRESRTCKILGFCSLGVGVPAAAIGAYLCALRTEDGVSVVAGAPLAAIGGTLTLASIPLFIVSHNKADRAKALSLGMTALNAPASTPASGPSTAPALGLTLSF